MQIFRVPRIVCIFCVYILNRIQFQNVYKRWREKQTVNRWIKKDGKNDWEEKNYSFLHDPSRSLKCVDEVAQFCISKSTAAIQFVFQLLFFLIAVCVSAIFAFRFRLFLFSYLRKIKINTTKFTIHGIRNLSRIFYGIHIVSENESGKKQVTNEKQQKSLLDSLHLNG